MIKFPGFFALLLCISFSLSADDSSKKSSDYLNELKSIKKVHGNKQEAKRFHALAYKAHKEKDYQESEKLWYKAALADPSQPQYYFNLACTTALQGKKDIAFDYVRIVIDFGPNDYYLSIIKDSDLAPIKNDARFENEIVKNISLIKFINDHEKVNKNEISKVLQKYKWLQGNSKSVLSRINYFYWDDVEHGEYIVFGDEYYVRMSNYQIGYFTNEQYDKLLESLEITYEGDIKDKSIRKIKIGNKYYCIENIEIGKYSINGSKITFDSGKKKYSGEFIGFTFTEANDVANNRWLEFGPIIEMKSILMMNMPTRYVGDKIVDHNRNNNLIKSLRKILRMY